MQKVFGGWLCVFAVLSVFICCESESDHISRVPSSAVLAVVDSIGILSGEDEYLFGVIGGACYLRNGNIAVADRTYRNVRVYNSAGEIQFTVESGGGGPGEFTSPLQVSTCCDGFAVNSIMDRKILYYNEDGVFVKEVLFDDSSIRPGCPVHISEVNEGLYFGHTFFMNDCGDGTLEGGTELALWDQNRVESVIRRRTSDSFNPMTYQVDARIYSCVDPERMMLYWSDASSENYVVNAVNLSTGIETTYIDRDIQPVAKPDSIIEQEHNDYVLSWRRGTGEDPDFEFLIDPYYRTIEGIGIGPDGKLWVRNGLKPTPSYDVFDYDGSFVFECTFEVSDYQVCDGWSIIVSPQGFLAYPRNPEIVGKLYILELTDYE